MQRLFWWCFAGTFCFFLTGCDYFNSRDLVPGKSTSAEVRERFGPPQQVWPNEDGSVTWEYSRQPKGAECYMITLDSSQVVQSVEQVIQEKNLARIRPGMGEVDVRRVLGKPASKQRFEPKRDEEVWSWLIDSGNLNDPMYFDVYFSFDAKVDRTGRHSAPRK